jgi:hypothetical protein
MLKRIIILLNIALVFQCSNAFGHYTVYDDRAKGGFKECREYLYNYKSGEINPKSKELLVSRKFDSIGNEIEFFCWKKDTILFRKTYKYDAMRNKIECIEYEHNGQINHKEFWKYNEKGNLIEYVYYKSDSSIFTKTNIKYDEKGNLIEEIEITPGGMMPYSEIKKKYNYKENSIETEFLEHYGKVVSKGRHIEKYNDKGKIIESNYFGSGDSLIFKEITDYDNKGNINEFNCFDSNGTLYKKIIYNYDINGKKIEEIGYDEESSIDFREINRYNEKGNNIDHIFYKPDGILYDKEITNYDNNGTKIKIINYKFDGLSDYLYHSCKYNERGLKIEDMYYEPNGNVESKENITYDEFGNIIEITRSYGQIEPEYCYKYIYSK